MQKIKTKEVYYFKTAYLAILEKDIEKYEEMMSKIKDQVTKQILESNKASLNGEIEKAKGLMKTTIKNTKGITQYMLVKRLEFMDLES